MSIEAMKQALEAWDLYGGGTLDQPLSSAMESIRTAIEQAEKQEPVAWVDLENWLTGTAWPDDVFSEKQLNGWTPLYTTPPVAQREWVGLTDDDLSVCDEDGVVLARYWEATLMEKNT